MVVKTITITEEAYEHLKNMKNEDESFTEMIERLYHPQNRINLKDFLGILKKEEVSELREIVAETRKNINKELKERSEKMGL